MNTPTPRTDAVYLEHRHWANEDEATEAIEDFRDFARTLERELATERDKVRVLRSACESIEEQWDKNHSANPFHAGNVMQSRAMRALAATEDTT